MFEGTVFEYATARIAQALTNFDAYEGSLSLGEVEPMTGDLDCDGNVDFDDINEFVLGLKNPTQYEDQFGIPASVKGDMDGDDDLDFDDVSDFISLLIGGGVTNSTQPVPEPPSLSLALAVLIALAGHRFPRLSVANGRRVPGTANGE